MDDHAEKQYAKLKSLATLLEQSATLTLTPENVNKASAAQARLKRRFADNAAILREANIEIDPTPFATLFDDPPTVESMPSMTIPS